MYETLCIESNPNTVNLKIDTNNIIDSYNNFIY